ncbi:Thioredoxin reductase [Candidatus Izimaplasma bacterium HR1]|jgi:thioredoxin reductase (NADPH)|uniref:NAD(P)/FAD-dependent oxidoreductase n=1 Tax=Candidatus Izimoplasma sp. HR1 TaxID=1541959 RepID=UPI0004F6819B|nr:Thioredoxin reductase [Candidatus Izimaplasma bacterium HR1]
MEKYDVIIIGAGPGGMTAAIYTQRSNLKTMMLEKAAPGGKMMTTFEIENYTGFGKIGGFELSEKMFNHTQELGVEYRYGDVTNIIDKGTLKEVHTQTGDVFEAGAVIIGSGTIPRSTKAAGESKLTGRGVSWCAICDGAFFKEMDIAVIGGGNSAIEEAIFLTKTVKHITVINLLPSLQADAKAVEQAKATGKMDFMLGYEVVSFNGDNQLTSITLRNVETKEESDLTVEGAFVFIGQIPEVSFAKDLNITNKWGYIEVNEKMETRVPGIYAIGDVINKELRQIITAASDGSIAAVEVARYLEKSNKI